jgi:hypothetical protein
MTTTATPPRIVVSADAALVDRWTVQRRERQVTSAQLLEMALDALTSGDGAGGAETRHLTRQLEAEQARSATLREELTAARAHATALRNQLQREEDDAIDLAAPMAPALDALWEGTHLPQLLLWRRDGAWLPEEEWPAHHRLVVHAARRRLAQLEERPSATAALNLSRVLQGDLTALLLTECRYFSNVIPYQSPGKAHDRLPPALVGAVIEARALRGLDVALDPYGHPVVPPEK